jgi:multicomponent Na+:H+ antiporter subunit E
MIAKIFMSVTWFTLWALLCWPPSTADLITGVAVAAFVTFMTADMLRVKAHFPKSPVRYLWFILYVIVFLWECLKANIDVAYRVIHPDLKIRPGTFKIRTSLKSSIGITFLANSITLTPGTTTVDIDRERGLLYVHCIYIKDPSITPERLPVAERFERILGKVFE